MSSIPTGGARRRTLLPAVATLLFVSLGCSDRTGGEPLSTAAYGRLDGAPLDVARVDTRTGVGGALGMSVYLTNSSQIEITTSATADGCESQELSFWTADGTSWTSGKDAYCGLCTDVGRTRAYVTFAGRVVSEHPAPSDPGTGGPGEKDPRTDDVRALELTVDVALPEREYGKDDVRHCDKK